MDISNRILLQLDDSELTRLLTLCADAFNKDGLNAGMTVAAHIAGDSFAACLLLSVLPIGHSRPNVRNATLPGASRFCWTECRLPRSQAPYERGDLPPQLLEIKLCLIQWIIQLGYCVGSAPGLGTHGNTCAVSSTTLNEK